MTEKLEDIQLIQLVPVQLDNFEPEDIIVVDYVDNTSKFRRLNSDDLEDWLEDYSIGELWEKNLLGGRPK